MSSKRYGFLALALAVVLMPAAALAGGPLLVFDAANDIPYAYATTSAVPIYTDLGSLGPVANGTADGQVSLAAGEWTGVPTSALSLAVSGDFADVGLPDVNDATTAGQVIGVFNGGGIHVIYDSDGSVTSGFFGAPPGVLGIASPDFATGAVLDESWVVLNGSTIDAADTNGDYWTGVITHEMGHSINLAHTQTNGASIYFGDPTTPQGCPGPFAGSPGFADIETMYPFIDPSPGSIGLDVRTIEHPDDVSALSDIYPTGGWPNAYGTISGTVYEADGVTPVTGVNVIVRNVADPFGDSNSQLSGNDTQGDLGPDGRFEFNGLTPGAEYVVYIDEIVDGGFSTTPTTLTIDEEWWNASESADPNVDDVCDFTGIVAVAGTAANADVVLTDPGPVLPLGDDDFIEVALGFDFPFCDGTSYSTVFVNSNGSLTFGAGDTDFSESVSDFLGGPARIAPLWDDLSPNEAGAVTAENVGGEFVVEFSGVPQFFTGDSNNFTVTLRPDGTYSIVYGDVNTQDAIVGRTQGNGAADPGETDLSGETQPIGFGLQTVYEDFRFETMDLANQVTEYTLCADLPPAVLDVDTTPIVVDVPVDGSENATLNIGNAATPPAQNLEWAIGAQGGASPIVIEGLSRKTPLFEPVRSRFGDASSSDMIIETSPLKSERAARELKPLAKSATINPDLFAMGPNVVIDGSFELGPFGGAWDEFSLNFGTPVCDALTCGTGTGTGPRTGLYWTWFGGIGAFEQGSMTQDVVIPAGNVTMSFWIEQIVCDSAADFMSVRIDGNEVYRTDGGSAICGQLGYTEVTLDLNALGYADGGLHTIEFYSEIFGTNGSGTNFFVDDVAIFEEIAECDFLTVAPNAGSTAAGDVTPVSLTFDATGLTPGTYECTVSITSNAGDATVPVVMNVVDPTVVGELLFTDSTLGGACDGSWLYATLVPPAGVDPADISVADVVLVDGVSPDPGYSDLVNLDGVGGADALVVRFECNDVSQAIGCGDDIAVLVTSVLAGGQGIEFPGAISNGAVFDVVFGDSWDGTPLQQILDDRYGPGAVDAATGYEGYLCGDAITPYWFDNQVESWIVREIAGYSNLNEMGWYTETYEMPTIDGVDDGIIFTGPDGAGASAVIDLPGVRRFGLWMNPRGNGDSTNAPEPELFFTNRNYNDEGIDGVTPPENLPFGGDPQALIYNVTEFNDGVPTFVVAWEDLDYGSPITPAYTSSSTDNDFNDLVIEIRAASPVSAVAAGLTVQGANDGVRLNWTINGLELVDMLEVHRTDPSGDRTVVARFGRNDLSQISNWTDRDADRAGTYYYQVAARIGDATVRSELIAFEQSAPNLVLRSQFRGAQPNPFNPRTEFMFSLSRSEEVRLAVYDVSGRLVTEMDLGQMNAGDHSVSWDATDDGGSRVASGVYFVQMVTPTAVDRMRVVLLK